MTHNLQYESYREGKRDGVEEERQRYLKLLRYIEEIQEGEQLLSFEILELKQLVRELRNDTITKITEKHVD